MDHIGVFRDNATKRMDEVIEKYPTIRRKAATDPEYYKFTRQAWDKLHAAGKISDDFPAIAKHVSDNKSALIDQLLEMSIIHEMSHATGDQHHHLKDALAAPPGHEQEFFAMGNKDCPMRYWANDIDLSLLEFDGKWNVAATAPDGTPWIFCQDACQEKFNLRD